MERIPERLSEDSLRRRREMRKRKSAEFLMGPVPVSWLTRAAALPGGTLATSLAIWFRSGCERSQRGLSICPQLLERFGVKRVAGYRALNALEKAGLVSVERHRGRCPLVTVHKGK